MFQEDLHMQIYDAPKQEWIHIRMMGSVSG